MCYPSVKRQKPQPRTVRNNEKKEKLIIVLYVALSAVGQRPELVGNFIQWRFHDQ